MSYSRQISVNVPANTDALELPAIKAAISQMMSCEEGEYEIMKAIGFLISVDIITSDTRISINDQGWNDLVENTAYSSGDFSRIKSIKFESTADATFIIDNDE